MPVKIGDFEVQDNINNVDKLSLGYYVASLVVLFFGFVTISILGYSESFSGFSYLFNGEIMFILYFLVTVVGAVAAFVTNKKELTEPVNKFACVALAAISLIIVLNLSGTISKYGVSGLAKVGIGAYLALVLHISYSAYVHLNFIKELLAKAKK